VVNKKVDEKCFRVPLFLKRGDEKYLGDNVANEKS
jgi:hypothetical protein